PRRTADRKQPATPSTAGHPKAPHGAGWSFGSIPVFSSDGRGLTSAPRDQAIDARPGEDPIHQPLIDQFRRQQGQPPGGIDPLGFPVGPSDAVIKYRPQPIGVLNGPFHAPIDEPDIAGMEIAVAVRMSGGDASDLASV